MLNKIVIYFLLLCFINTAFLPGENIDDTPFNGVEEVEEEYNSLYELVREGFMEIEDPTPEDEDDDLPDWLKKTSNFFYCQIFEVSFNLPKVIHETRITIKNKISSLQLEISSPPPKIFQITF